MKKKKSGRIRLLLIVAMVMLCGALVFAFLYAKPFLPAAARSPEVRTVVRHKIPTPAAAPTGQDIAPAEPPESSQTAVDASQDQHNEAGPAPGSDVAAESGEILASPLPAAQVATPPSIETAMKTNFTIQVGAFREKANAQQTRIRWQGKGCDAYILEFVDAGRRPWYFVRFGRFDTREEAVSSLADFQTTGEASAIIVDYKTP